jgi:hypothetical protein
MSDEHEPLQRFFADLANRRSLRELPGEQVDRLLNQFRDAVGSIRRADPIVTDIDAIPRDLLVDRLCLRQQQFKELTANVLGATWLSARASTPVGVDAVHPIPLTMVARRAGGRIVWDLTSAERNDPTAAAALLAVTTDGGFGFGVCRLAECRRIFARSRRGRPQKYCSAACKGRGVPSAKKRSTYVTAYRARQREEDLRRVLDVLKQCRREDRYAILRRIFPGRAAKSILYVMRQAEKRLDAAKLRRKTKPSKRQPNEQSSDSHLRSAFVARGKTSEPSPIEGFCSGNNAILAGLPLALIARSGESEILAKGPEPRLEVLE